MLTTKCFVYQVRNCTAYVSDTLYLNGRWKGLELVGRKRLKRDHMEESLVSKQPISVLLSSDTCASPKGAQVKVKQLHGGRNQKFAPKMTVAKTLRHP